jgi:hypothetical protein
MGLDVGRASTRVRAGEAPRDPAWLRLRDHAGGYELAGWLDREAGEILRSALSPLAALPRATDVEVGVRTATQRDADALVGLAARALSDGALPTEGGGRLLRSERGDG